ncbi:Sensor histidine kinase YesM [Evansella caseinilytica]|uniref:histidine kinase n=1 Tax=Evansella caseinilytica TaxID=1503961 RepID=A0A1H3GK94_9BACI|nr:sensor histidine kinase [Evansella caseinilytica]SDY02934.1 Sensor histidine kinase YesM [Evansella caseinilytica]
MKSSKRLTMPIRKKFTLYFIVFFFILISLSLFSNFNYNQTVHQYNHIQERFFLLNDVSQKSTKTYEAMDVFLNKQLATDYEQYRNSRQALVEAKDLLKEKFQNEHNYTSTKNYLSMIDSLLEESDTAIAAFLADDLEVYSSRQKEAFMLIGFIQDQTLSLLNDDLSMFQTYYDAINERNDYMQLTLISMTATALVSGLFITYLFSNSITAPIYQLTETARQVSAGELDGPKLPESNDEIGFLAQTFNKMRIDLANNVRQLKEKSEQEKLLKEMELKSLQSQINPHFLFNTLNTISKCALIDGSEKIYKLINSLSKMLRYNLGSMDKPVTLSDEINVVQDYFYIQKTRFESRVRFVVNISKECLSLKIPVLTLQPLVENAFIHGIEPYEQQGLIEIEGYTEDQFIVLNIRDNGIGMDFQTKQRILNKSYHTSPNITANASGHSTGLGLTNVLKRLELFYHFQHRVTIDSEAGKGTMIQLMLPKHSEEEGSYV